MKKSLLIIIATAFLSITGAYSQVYKTVQVDTAGKLDSLLTAEELTTITDLTLTGEINLDDYNTMKSMPALRVIDLGAVHTTGDSIPGFAFRGDVRSVILPSSVTKLGIYAFTSCSSLTALTIPYGVTTIPYYAFAGCSSLTSVILPETVTRIERLAFAGCSRLPFIDLPDSVTYIGEQAFVACDSMSTIVIPPGVTELVPNAFAGCSCLDSVVIGSSVTSIGMNAFAGCSNLKSITIPPSVDSIAPFAFVSCPGLTSVTIESSSETYVGDYAFAGDANLASVTISSSDGVSLGNYAFVACTSLKSLNMATRSVTSIGEWCFVNSMIDSVVFPSSLKSIAKYAFLNNDSLRSVTFLPSSGTSIGEGAFQDCLNLVSVTMNSPSVDSIGKYAFRDCRITGTLTMPSSLEHIGEYAFYRQPIDTLIFLPSSGTYLGMYSFAYNPDLTSIIMYSPSVDTIDDRCFSDCSNLKNVILPSSLASIQYGAFGWDNNLEWFRINSLTPPVLPEGINVFPYWTGGPINLYVPSGTKEAYQAAVFWSGFPIIEYDLNLSANPDTLTIADTANTVTFEITSSVNWQVSLDQQWLTASPMLGIDTAVITLTAKANPDTVVREAVVTLSGVNVPLQTVVVIQDPMPALSVSDHIMDIGWQDGSKAHFTINSNQEWTVQSSQPWLEVSQLSGSQSHEIFLTAGANPDIITREATITVYSGRLAPEIIKVTQLPKMYLTVDASEMGIGPDEGSTAQFNVLTNALWTVRSDQSWLTVNFASGIGNVEIILTAASNPEFEVRDAIITVSVDGLPAQIITVTQEAAIPTGLTDASGEDVGIYPNPVKNVLHIDHAAGREIILFDTWGRILLSQKLSGEHETLDLTFLAPGEYLVKIGDRIIKVIK